MINPINLMAPVAGSMPRVPATPAVVQPQGSGPVGTLLHDVGGIAHKALQVGSKVAFLAL